MTLRTGAALLLAALLATGGGGAAHAHGVLRVADPPEGATLDDAPAAVRLTFSESPDAALSEIRVVGTNGVAYQAGRAVLVLNDPLSISIDLEPLDRGVYTVSWRVVSSVDGHATSGAYAFGVGADPSAAVAAAATEPTAAASIFQMVARWMLLAGLVLLAGAAAATVGKFGGKSDVPIAAAGALLALSGVLLLGIGQARNASVSFADLLNSPVGRSLLWRLTVIAGAGAALVPARRREVELRRPAMALALIASLAAMAIHVAGGHAAASSRWTTATIASQWVHFAASGIWFGGLAALLIGVRGAPSALKADAIRRFSSIASIGILAVALTGIARSAGELTSWGDLASTAYGQVLLAKVALTIGIAVCAAANHWRSVTAAVADLRPLRSAGAAEVVLAGCALAAAAVLGSLPPPAAQLQGASGFEISGADFGTTLRVRVTGSTDQAGPNRFVVTVTDYDTGEPIEARRATLRFTPLDDPRMESSALELVRRADGAFTGSGSQLAFAGRWRITALIEREDDSVDVAIEHQVRNQSK